MTLSELRYIVAVAAERSFGRAAEKCFVSQPALSVAIQKLEEELGARLFERSKSEITVTPVGERVVEQAQKVLEEMARVREVAQAGRNPLAGPLRLGVIYTVAPYLLPDLIPALHELAHRSRLSGGDRFCHPLYVAADWISRASVEARSSIPAYPCNTQRQWTTAFWADDLVFVVGVASLIWFVLSRARNLKPELGSQEVPEGNSKWAEESA